MRFSVSWHIGIKARARVGYDSAIDSNVSEIEGATYSGSGTEPQLVIIPFPLSGVYVIDVLGIGTGSYTIELESTFTNGTVIGALTLNGSASHGKLDTYSIEFKEDYTLLEAQQPEPFPLWIIAAIVIIAAFGTVLYLFKIRKKSQGFARPREDSANSQ